MRRRITATITATAIAAATLLSAGLTAAASTTGWTGTAAISTGLPDHTAQPDAFPYHG